ncbi:MAG TPA: hypothetical protein VLT33_46725 [Labilithrix sp.]|nr:hypothetical protein [Labilithrix sp.]
MRPGSLVAIAALTVALCSCSSSSSSTSPTPAAGAVTQAIGPEGGKIEVGGAVVTFPKGAVAASTSVTISVLDTTPEGFVTLSKLFKCEPSGIDFAQPVEMRMPFTDDGSGGSLFWSSGSDPAFKDLGGKVEGNIMIATVQHFSSGFVGRKK